MRIFIAIAFLLILASLGSALFFMMRDRGTTKRMAYSLTLRVGFSVALFLFILFANWMGWIHSTGTLY
ncbi:MAG: twin transmembrane helix small protein [Janthinobacterium lividum]